MSTKRRKKSEEAVEAQKSVLAQHRQESRAVNAYLDALADRARRTPRRSAEVVERQLKMVDEALLHSEGARRVHQIQRRLDLLAELDAMENGADLPSVEQQFIEIVAPYSDRRGLTYAAWREAGVPARVLKAGGVSR